MTDSDLRLECLKIVSSQGLFFAADMMKEADTLFNYVRGTKNPSDFARQCLQRVTDINSNALGGKDIEEG